MDVSKLCIMVSLVSIRLIRLFMEILRLSIGKSLFATTKLVHKSKFNLWLVLQNRLATCDRVSRWMHGCNVICCLCNIENESVLHLFFHCRFSIGIWAQVMQQVKRVPLVADFPEVTRIMQEKARSKKDEDRVLVMLFTGTVYTIWTYRHMKVFEQQSTTDLSLIREIIFNTACNSNEK